MCSARVSRSTVVALVAGLLVAAPGAAWATAIPIANPSFEANNPGNTSGIGYSGTQDYAAIGALDWTPLGGGVSGWWHPSTLEYPGGGSASVAATNIPNGAQIAFVNGGSGFRQVLTTRFAQDQQYTLSFSVGERKSGVALPSSYTVELLAGGTVIASALNPGLGGLTPGQFVASTLTYTSPIGDPLAGQFLAVEMSASGSGGAQVNFDNFNLDVVDGAAPISEPWSLAVLGFGLLATLGACGARPLRKAKLG